MRLFANWREEIRAKRLREFRAKISPGARVWVTGNGSVVTGDPELVGVVNVRTYWFGERELCVRFANGLEAWVKAGEVYPPSDPPVVARGLARRESAAYQEAITPRVSDK